MVAAKSTPNGAEDIADRMVSFDAQPYAFQFDPAATALLVIDMQRDFLLKDGFGHIQAGDAGVEKVQATIQPTLKVLRMFRDRGLHVIHTREGHRPDLRDAPAPKLLRQARAPNTRHSMVIGDVGPMGRLLTRGEYGHDIIDELRPVAGEYVVDKPGKGSFFSTSLLEHLVDRGITHLIVVGVTVECCVTTTVREANDRGFEACILRDCTDGFVPTFKSASLDMIHFSEGLFGYVGESHSLLAALTSLPPYPKQPETDWNGSMSIEDLKSAYFAGLSPTTVVKYVLQKISSDKSQHPAVWLNLASLESLLRRAEDLEKSGDRNLPLFGIPFAVKDNIDVQGLPTTAACPDFAYVPSASAHVVSKLEAAGAIVVGKTNMDQFATGLVGTRSPYGACHCAFDSSRVSGGSSSGSAVAVALRHVSFALGTDTAGSGRVPAAFNCIVGLKPTKGTVSTTGVLPACRTLDCVSFFAQSIPDARVVWLTAKNYDSSDAYSRCSPNLAHLTSRSVLHEESTFTVSIPGENILNRELSAAYREQFTKIISLVRHLPHIEEVDFDWKSYLSASDLLYQGAFVAERSAALQEVLHGSNPVKLHPVTQKVLASADSMSAADAFRDLYEAQRLLKLIEGEFDKCDILIVPTAPNHPTIEEAELDPIVPNLKLGVFASAVNVLDLAAIAIPVGYVEGLPFGISIIAPAFKEGFILKVAERIQARLKHFEL